VNIDPLPRVNFTTEVVVGRPALDAPAIGIPTNGPVIVLEADGQQIVPLTNAFYGPKRWSLDDWVTYTAGSGNQRVCYEQQASGWCLPVDLAFPVLETPVKVLKASVLGKSDPLGLG